jgi:hypothetical protein
MTGYRDSDWPEAPGEDPPAGRYLIAFIRGRRLERYGNQKIELDFEIVEPAQWAKRIIKMYFAAPKEGPMSQDSKYFENWRLANGGPPKRGDRMTPQVFHGYWQAEAGYTQKKAGREGRLVDLKADETGRLVIVRLLAREAGAAASPSRRGGKSNLRMN